MPIFSSCSQQFLHLLLCIIDWISKCTCPLYYNHLEMEPDTNAAILHWWLRESSDRGMDLRYRGPANTRCLSMMSHPLTCKRRCPSVCTVYASDHQRSLFNSKRKPRCQPWYFPKNPLRRVTFIIFAARADRGGFRDRQVGEHWSMLWTCIPSQCTPPTGQECNGWCSSTSEACRWWEINRNVIQNIVSKCQRWERKAQEYS